MRNGWKKNKTADLSNLKDSIVHCMTLKFSEYIQPLVCLRFARQKLWKTFRKLVCQGLCLMRLSIELHNASNPTLLALVK